MSDENMSSQSSSEFEANQSSESVVWPALPFADWKDTCSTLQMWAQIVGKVRMKLSPHLNHFWESTFYVTSRGLTTSPIPYRSEVFECEFDLFEHKLDIRTSWNDGAQLALKSMTVADFYHDFFEKLHHLGIEVTIWPMPVEVPNPIRFDQDREHASYDGDYVHRFWRVLASVDRVLKEFRSFFIGKVSPVHLFWGSFDLAVTRFSGRPAPFRPNADPITRDSYSHEVISAGFWPGGGAATGIVDDAAFYAYAAPEPAGFRDVVVEPSATYYHDRLNEFILPYEEVRHSLSPSDSLMDFLMSTYEAGADFGHWDRQDLERPALAHAYTHAHA